MLLQIEGHPLQFAVAQRDLFSGEGGVKLDGYMHFLSWKSTRKL